MSDFKGTIYIGSDNKQLKLKNNNLFISDSIYNLEITLKAVIDKNTDNIIIYDLGSIESLNIIRIPDNNIITDYYNKGYMII